MKVSKWKNVRIQALHNDVQIDISNFIVQKCIVKLHLKIDYVFRINAVRITFETNSDRVCRACQFKHPIGFQPNHILQVDPPSAITSISLSSDWGLLAAGKIKFSESRVSSLPLSYLSSYPIKPRAKPQWFLAASFKTFHSPLICART